MASDVALCSSVLVGRDEQRRAVLPGSLFVLSVRAGVAESLMPEFVTQGPGCLPEGESSVQDDAVATASVFAAAVVPEVLPLNLDAEVDTVLHGEVEAVPRHSIVMALSARPVPR